MAKRLAFQAPIADMMRSPCLSSSSQDCSTLPATMSDTPAMARLIAWSRRQSSLALPRALGGKARSAKTRRPFHASQGRSTFTAPVAAAPATACMTAWSRRQCSSDWPGAWRQSPFCRHDTQRRASHLNQGPSIFPAPAAAAPGTACMIQAPVLLSLDQALGGKAHSADMTCSGAHPT